MSEDVRLRPSRMTNEALLREYCGHCAAAVEQDASPDEARRCAFVYAEILRRMVEPRR